MIGRASIFDDRRRGGGTFRISFTNPQGWEA